MGSEQNIAASSKDAYEHQRLYEERKNQRKIILSWIFFGLSVVSLVLAFILPVYEYAHRNKKTQYRIEGKFTFMKMITEYFNGGLGEEKGMLNTLAMVSAILILVCMVYLIISTFIAAMFRGKLTGIAAKLFGYGTIEVVSALQFVFLFANMISAKVDVLGEAKNLSEFWVVFFTSYLFIALSISLSTIKKS